MWRIVVTKVLNKQYEFMKGLYKGIFNGFHRCNGFHRLNLLSTFLFRAKTTFDILIALLQQYDWILSCYSFTDFSIINLLLQSYEIMHIIFPSLYYKSGCSWMALFRSNLTLKQFTWSRYWFKIKGLINTWNWLQFSELSINW